MKDKILVVVAHPDDESLGAGGTIMKLVDAGNEVAVMVMVSMARARAVRPDDRTMLNDQELAMGILGVKKLYNTDFPNNELNTIPQLHLVQEIEKRIAEFSPDVIITHHMNDLNNDHYIVSEACQVASRMPLRTQEHKPVREIWSMEVLSSSEWSMQEPRFSPNLYIPVDEVLLERKFKAVDAYYGVTRKWPHPRNRKTIEALAVVMGAECGCRYAEAFEILYQVQGGSEWEKL